MSELTNKRLEEIASGQNTVSIPEAAMLARELLTLRTLRDAGDEEVERMMIGLMNDLSIKSQGSRDTIKMLRDIAITRGQQLREAREEIERLKGDAERYRWLRSHSWHEPYHIFFGPGCNQLEPHHLDQAIDKEMKYPIQGEDKPQYEEGDGGYYDLLPGGLDQ